MGSYVPKNIVICQFGKLSRNSRNYLICTALSIPWRQLGAPRCQVYEEGGGGWGEGGSSNQATHPCTTNNQLFLTVREK